MTMDRFKTWRVRCVILWILAPLITLLLIAIIGWPWLERLRTLDGQIATATDQLHRYQQLLRALPTLQTELEQVTANQEFRTFYIDTPTSALAGAELQRRLQDMVRAADGRLISTQVLPSPTQEVPQSIRVRTQIQGDVETLLELLLDIERARPFIFVDQLSVRSIARPVRPVRPARPGQSGSQAQRQIENQLTVRLDVFGYILGGQP